MTVRVLVAEDQALVRAGFVTMLRSDPEIEVVAEAGDGLEALERATATRPDVALVDVRMPRCDGLAATRRIVEELPGTRVVILTTFGDDEIVLEALRAGAVGFLLKDVRPEDLLSTVHDVAAGHARLDPAVTAAVVARVRRSSRVVSDPAIDSLTAREREVLVLMARGLSNAEIAEALFVTQGTAKTHVAAILAKLNARDRVQAVVAAFESGLVS